MDKIKMIKKNAIIDIKIGTGFIQKLQQLLIQIASELTPEQLEQYKKETADFKDISHEFSEPWMNSLTTISILLRDIESEASIQGKTYEGSIEDAIA
jgi:hypothetical protein